MPRISDRPLHRTQMRLFRDDYEKLKQMAGPDVPIAVVIRAALKVFLNETEARMRAKIDEAEREMR